MSCYRVLCAACLLTGLAHPTHAHHPVIGSNGGSSGPITTISAETLPEGKINIGINEEYLHLKKFSDDELATMAGQHIHAHSVDWILSSTIGISYGLTPNLTLSMNIPLVYRNNVRAGSHHHAGGMAINEAENHGSTTGIGDFSALGQYRFLSHDNLQSAFLLGAKFPTGRVNVRHDNETLDAEFQPGSGSWDGLAGLAARTQTGSIVLDANILYINTTEGTQDTDLGNRLQYNLGLSHRIGGEFHDHGHGKDIHQHPAWDLVLELNGEWAGKQKENGVKDEESGGNTILLSPGFRYVPDNKWSAHLSVGVPVIDKKGEGHTGTDYKITFGVSRTF